MENNEYSQFSDEQLWAHLRETENEEKVDLLLELASRSTGRGDNIEAASLAEQAASEAEKSMASSVVENARYRQGIAYWRAQRYEESLAAFQLGVQTYEEPDPKIELSKNQWGIASSLYFQENYADSAEWARISTESAVSEEAYSMAGLNKFLEAKALYMDDRETQALEACEVARGYRRIEKELNEVAEIDAYMAQIHTYLGNSQEASGLLRNCLVLADATSSNYIKYYSYRLGNSLIDLGEYEEARAHLERARDLYQEEEDHASLADCFYSLSLTYRGSDQVDIALELTRSAVSLWDALGSNSSYVKGLQRIAILLFSKDDFASAIDVNKRIMDFIDNPTDYTDVEYYGWALLRKIDCHRVRQEWEIALDLLESTEMFGQDSQHPANSWYYSLKARALYALDRHEEAMGVADTALAQTKNDEVDLSTAQLYEIKARVSLEQNRSDKERQIAHAIALLLAFGETSKARELSDYFKPDFSPRKSDNILADENPDNRVSGIDEQPPGFGFAPN
jgi:tetratricopeptide (TPR) repeat protein